MKKIIQKGTIMKYYQYIALVIVSLVGIITSKAQFPNVRVSTNTYDQSEMAIAVSPLNGNLLLGSWNDFRITPNTFSQAGFGRSTDGGDTWQEGILPAPSNQSSYIYGFDPSVAFDRYGNAFYGYIATSYSNYLNDYLGATYVAKSTDGGANWINTNIRQVSTATIKQDKPFIAIDNTGGARDGRIYVSWTDFSSGSNIKFAYSSDHGVTFSITTLGSKTGSPGPSAYAAPSKDTAAGQPLYTFVQGSMPAVAPNGDVYVIWMENNTTGDNTSSFKIRKSTDGGVTFGTTQTGPSYTYQKQLIGLADIRNFPSLAVAPNGDLCLVYTNRISSSDIRRRIHFSKSTNGGSTWSTPILLWEPGTNGWQFFPSITIDPTGRLNIAFMCTDNTLTLADAYLTVSTDNGASFGLLKKVSSQSSNPRNASWTHHYMGVASISATNKVFELWTDYRNGNPDPYFQALTNVVAPVIASYNMVGVPNVVDNFAKSAVYPTALTAASRWDPNTAQYIATDPLSNGVGYWIQFPTPPGTVSTIGAPIYSQAMSVIKGTASAWNMIGSITKDVATSSVVQNPPNIVISQYFIYNNGYQATTTLYAGLGHWLKVSASGTLTLSASSPKISSDGSDPFASLDCFTVKDANGGSQKMYVKNHALFFGKIDGDEDGNVEMPPDPPADFFNVRFKTGNYVQSVSPDQGRTTLPILVKSAVYPLTLEWDTHQENAIQYWVNVNDNIHALSGKGSLVIENQRATEIVIEAVASSSVLSSKPTEYSLGQNYPNPFNPSTTIFYTLPESKHVKIVVYDVLGREIATLVEGTQNSGFKSVNFDASHLPSGVYFYKLTAGKFTQVRKMLLAK